MKRGANKRSQGCRAAWRKVTDTMVETHCCGERCFFFRSLKSSDHKGFFFFFLPLFKPSTLPHPSAHSATTCQRALSLSMAAGCWQVLSRSLCFLGSSKQSQALHSATATTNHRRRRPAAVAGRVGVPATAQGLLPDSTPTLYVAIR